MALASLGGAAVAPVAADPPPAAPPLALTTRGKVVMHPPRRFVDHQNELFAFALHDVDRSLALGFRIATRDEVTAWQQQRAVAAAVDAGRFERLEELQNPELDQATAQLAAPSAALVGRRHGVFDALLLGFVRGATLDLVDVAWRMVDDRGDVRAVELDRGNPRAAVAGTAAGVLAAAWLAWFALGWRVAGWWRRRTEARGAPAAS